MISLYAVVKAMFVEAMHYYMKSLKKSMI